MRESVHYENINQRELFVLEILVKSLVDFNDLLERYQDRQYLFVLRLGTIVFGEFVSFG